MRLRSFWFLLISLMALATARARGHQDTRQPNIIFILADDLGWGDLRCYGHPQIRTPHLDRLAQQGTLFTQFYVNGSVCSPSRTAFMTGQYPARHRVHGHFATAEQNANRGMPNWLAASAATLPRQLKSAGYATAHFGKWHLGSGPGAPPPADYGFDMSRAVNANGPGFDQGENEGYFRARSTGLFVDETLRFIKANQRKPFYVQLWTLVPHATLNPTEEQMEPYRQLGPGKVPHKGTKQIYYAAVTDLDTQIGRLLSQLDEMGVANNTLILFSSDNGPEEIFISNASHSGIGSPGPFRGRKRSLYEGGVRVPFLVRWPGRVPAGRVDETSVVTAVDFLPTLCKLAGAKLPPGWALDGEEASEVILGRARPRTKPILWEWRFNVFGHVWNRSPILSIRDGDWKLMMNPDRSRVELYNIPKDAMEQNNVADRHADVVARLSAKLGAFQKTLPPGPRDPGAGKNDYPMPRGRPAPS